MTRPTLLEASFHDYVDLIPLTKGGKRPLDRNWTERIPDFNRLRRLVSAGHNYGVRLDASLLVVDVDPRHFDDGDDPFTRLCADAGLDPEDYPTVRTGGGGLHVFMSKPRNRRVSGKLPGYKGIDFKTKGGQVVAAGSVHPETGKAYEWDSINDLSDPPPPAPDALLDLIGRKATAKSPPAEAILDAESLERLLDNLDPADFPDNETWEPLIMTLHDACGGDAHCGEVFDLWCQGGPGYRPDVLNRWRSLDVRKGSRRSVGSLRRLLDGNANALAVLDRAQRGDAADDFDDNIDGRPTAPEANDWSAIAGTFATGRPRILRDAGEWLEYRAETNRYERQDEERFDGAVRRHLEGLTVRDRGKERRMRPNRGAVSETGAALKARCQAPGDLPCWLDGGGPDVRDLLPVRNGVLNLETGELLPPTDRLGTRNSAQVDFDPAAECPRWERFVREVLSEDGLGEEWDRRTGDALQECMGYLLTQDTSLQKIFLLVSQPRGGKGTIQRVLTRLVGERSVTSPTSDSLKGDFGLAPFIGRQVALIGDARTLSDRKVVEKLLIISGEDRVTVNVKNERHREVRLPTRVMIATNNLPQFRDASNAIVSRLIVLRLRASFLGREDRGLEEALEAELPGILNWCLVGLRRVRERGRIDNPPSAEADLALMGQMSSPVAAFAEEMLERAPGQVVPSGEVYDAFEDWLLMNDLRYTGGSTYFPNDLRSVVPWAEKTRRRIDGTPTHVYLDLRLRRE